MKELARILEPRAPVPKERLEIMQKCKKEGFLVGVDYIPILPFLEKHYPELLPKYKSLFRIFSQPSKEYQKKLEEKSKRLCKKYYIALGAERFVASLLALLQSGHITILYHY